MPNLRTCKPREGQPGAQQGFCTSLDRCAAYVASLTRKE